MNKHSYDRGLFSGLVFWGLESFPRDLIISLDSIRKWAIEQKLIWDLEAQLLGSERIEQLSKHFVPGDKLSILIHLYKEPSGNIGYAEYPYLPIRSLIRRGETVEIVYWEMRPSVWDSDGNVKAYGEVRFGFWYPNVGDEFCSASNAKLIAERFHKFYHDPSTHYERKTLDNGVLSVEVDGDVKGRFFKSGRFFDVELS